jgi:protein-S-isoprenylcysteine O-methyltransferase Ste14
MTRTRAAIGLVILSAIFPLCLFPFAGRWDWPVAWGLVGLMASATLLSRLLVARIHPDLLEERAQSLNAENTQPGDRVLAPAMGLAPLLVLMVAGLDDRFHWSSGFSTELQIAGLALVAFGYVFATWAMLVNRFFSGVVRIQTERGHRVVDEGPYAIVRHPGYAGSLLASFSFPLVLSSAWAFVPVLLVLLVTVARVRLEERALAEGLPGYAEYQTRTRFRLVPGVW